MKILVADTSSSVCSVGVFEDNVLINKNELANGKTHSENFMPLVEKTLNEAKLKLDDIEYLAVVVGPGSFTGIRIGVASCKAMAEIKGLKVVPVYSLDSLAANEVENGNVICSMIDARNNQVYCGIYDNKINKLEEYMADDIENVLLVLNKYDDIVFVGDGAGLHEDMIREKMVGKKIVFSSNNKQNAESLGIIAYKKIKNGEFTDPDSVVPVYLRKSQAERLKDAKENF